MSKSIKPNTEVFQYAIRYLPTGKYLKKRPGYSFYETDIPSVYVSAKVAMKSLADCAKWASKYKPEDCEIVKFRIIMEEVKELSENEIAYEEELKKLNLQRKILGEIHWEEVTSERQKLEIFHYIEHADVFPISTGESLHCYDKVYKVSHGTYQFVWSHDQDKYEMPISISRAVDHNWDEKIRLLKHKYGIK